ncbi:MAG: ABC transporter permease [Deltaproteobacteria bacterium]|nr:MAG: ABC transporter permease [Deltaproteobacteria bacterium]
MQGILTWIKNHPIVRAIEGFGQVMMFAGQVLWLAIRPPYRINLLISQMYFVGIGSLFIILLTGVFSGAVFALQSSVAFAMVGAEGLVGSSVAVSLCREIAPVFGGLLVTGRVGSAMATELGTMRVTEQIDALETIAVNPIQYLVVPRVLATLIMLPVLTLMFDFVGMIGSYLVGVVFLEIDQGIFLQKIWWYLDPEDIYSGLIKAAVFGFALSLLGCYKGYKAGGGARGVGMAATQSVVASSVTILIMDYFLTLIMLEN